MSNDYSGTVTLTSGADERLHVERADERIQISRELLNQFRAGVLHTAVSLAGNVLTITATNRTVRYRLVNDGGASKRIKAERIDEPEATT